MRADRCPADRDGALTLAVVRPAGETDGCLQVVTGTILAPPVSRRWRRSGGADGGFSAFLEFVGRAPIRNRWTEDREVPATTTEVSDASTSDLKARGFRFLGSTTLYAYLRAVGLVNGHLVSCFRYAELRRLP